MTTYKLGKPVELTPELCSALWSRGDTFRGVGGDRFNRVMGSVVDSLWRNIYNHLGKPYETETR